MRAILLAAAAMTLIACKSIHPAITTAERVDLDRFMGEWHVIGNIPTSIEREAYNAVETYRLDSDGTIATTFTFNKGGDNGPMKTYTPRGFVRDRATNAVWGMQFVWPIKADYRIVYVDPDYQHTIVGREKRDYLWIMARAPRIPESTYQELLQIAVREGYDASMVRRVPQRAENGAGAP